MTALDPKAPPSLRPTSVSVLLLAMGLLCLVFCTGARAVEATAVGWGANVHGQVGTGTTNAGGCLCIKVPEPVKVASGATEIAAGNEHTLALLADGSVMAWGENGAGQLGDGTTSGPDCARSCNATPAPVPSLANVVAVAAGSAFSLALLSDGTVMAWGGNFSGELGDGTVAGPDCNNKCRPTPARVPGLTGVVSIAAAGDHSLALLADGTVVSWGFDESGETGDGTGASGTCRCIDEPTPVKGVTGAMAISAGRFGGLALLADGTVKAWGRAEFGVLGDGTVTPPPGACECLGPISVSGLAGVQTIAAGGFHSLARMPGGSVQAWGENGEDQLGSDQLGGCVCGPTPAPVVGLSDPVAIAAGAFHSLALVSNGTVRAWGSNRDGAIGDETAKNREIPTTVRGIGGAGGVLTGASAIAAGDRNSFALIGPSQTLKIELAGAGAGAVGGAGILCPSGCEAHYPQGQVENLRAEPKPGSGFAGFSGPCTGTAGVCRLTLDQDRSLTATFGPPKGTKITKAKIAKRSASFSFSAPGAITGFQCTLAKPHLAHHKKPKTRFSACKTPQAFKHLRPGRYTFKVRALDVLGADAHPATRHFTVKARRAGKAKDKR